MDTNSGGKKTYKMIVHRINLEKTRALYFEKDNDNFKVISLIGDAYWIKPGDEIEYEIGGINFGWLVKPKLEVDGAIDSDATEKLSSKTLLRQIQQSAYRRRVRVTEV